MDRSRAEDWNGREEVINDPDAVAAPPAMVAPPATTVSTPLEHDSTKFIDYQVGRGREIKIGDRAIVAFLRGDFGADPMEAVSHYRAGHVRTLVSEAREGGLGSTYGTIVGMRVGGLRFVVDDGIYGVEALVDERDNVIPGTASSPNAPENIPKREPKPNTAHAIFGIQVGAFLPPLPNCPALPFIGIGLTPDADQEKCVARAANSREDNPIYTIGLNTRMLDTSFVFSVRGFNPGLTAILGEHMRVERITMDTRADASAALIKLLMRKFGKPSRQSATQWLVGNRELSTAELEWKRADVLVHYSERVADPTSGQATDRGLLKLRAAVLTGMPLAIEQAEEAVLRPRENKKSM